MYIYIYTYIQRDGKEAHPSIYKASADKRGECLPIAVMAVALARHPSAPASADESESRGTQHFLINT